MGFFFSRLPRYCRGSPSAFCLFGKERIDGKTIRMYDRAKTPYRHVLNLEELPFALKARLSNQYLKLNPVALRASIDAKVALLWKIVR